MDITPYDFAGKTVQILIDETGNPWWIGTEVCCALGLSDVSKSLKTLDSDEKLIRKLFVSGQNRDVWLINEPGLYRLISRSNKKRAKITTKKIP
jgi:anti-repressor protein